MNYIEEMFHRTNIQQIRNFLMYGVECFDDTDATYAEREDSAWKTLVKKMETALPNKEERENFTNDITCYTCETEHIYMEVGMQCGARLIMQLLSEK